MKTITSFNIVYTVYDEKTKTYSNHNVGEDFMKKVGLNGIKDFINDIEWYLQWYVDGREKEFYQEDYDLSTRYIDNRKNKKEKT